MQICQIFLYHQLEYFIKILSSFIVLFNIVIEIYSKKLNEIKKLSEYYYIAIIKLQI
jgi:hypothetical protein